MAVSLRRWTRLIGSLPPLAHAELLEHRSGVRSKVLLDAASEVLGDAGHPVYHRMHRPLKSVAVNSLVFA